MPPEAQPPAKFDPGAPHQQRPKLRPVRGFPAQVGEQVLLGLADARQISDKMVVAPMQVQTILPLMNGERAVAEIVAQIGGGLTDKNLEGFIAQLDEAGLLFGPKFDLMLAQMRKEFDSAPVLPPSSTAAMADSLAVQKLGQEAPEEERAKAAPGLFKEALDEWIKAALEKEDNPSFDELPRAIIVPHIDYPRGWLNYASVWGRMRVVDRPDRVVILGTNHFGMGTGVTGCDKGFQTPLGTCAADAAFIELVKKKLGPDQAGKLFENRFDHEREHSIELQIAWIQHCLGPDAAGEFCPVFGALVHDPTVNGGNSYDGKGLGLDPFVEALRAAIDEAGGKTLVVASADLSHVGPMFGDQQAMAGETPEVEEARNKVIAHDQEMLQHIIQAQPDNLIAAMAWQQNPTRWCSTGNLVAALKVVKPEKVDVLRYMAALDQQGMGMVTSAGAVMR